MRESRLLIGLGLLALSAPACVEDTPGGGDDVIPAVVVRNQICDPANRVVIDSATTDGGGFLVVHQGDGSGGIGGVVGVSAYLDTGETTSVNVTLSREAIDGETLYAMLHADGGDQVYGFPDDGTDGPVLDADGVVIAPPFAVTVPSPQNDISSVTVSSQIADPSTRVVIDEVYNVRDGFLVVHAANEDGDVGGVIGVSEFLPAGVHAAVNVTLDQAVTNGQTLFAMLHVDGDENGVYQFPGPDGPELDAGGNIITPPFAVFLTDPAPAVVVRDQAAGNAVSVLAAVSDGPGFMVIHEANGSNIGALIGVSAPLVDGINSNIGVVLDRQVEDGETLFAMLHIDDGDGQFNLPEDAAVRDDDDEIIAPPFVVTLDLDSGVTVSNQELVVPDEVHIDSVVHDRAHFIIIHEDGGNAIGGVIGASEVLGAGAHENVIATLDRNAVDGETLYAMLHDDGNDNGVYDGPSLDPPVTDANGVIAPPFAVTVPTTVVAENQVAGADGYEVTIATVIYDGGAFIAVHEANANGDIGPIVGVSAYLPPGSNEDISVLLNRPVDDGETLFAMLHMDGNGDQQYNFPGPDGPVTDADANVIAPPFVVEAP